MNRRRYLLDKSCIAVRVSSGANEQRVRSAADRALDCLAPDVEDGLSEFLALRRISLRAGLAEPLFNLANLVAPTHVRHANVVGPEVLADFEEVGLQLVGPFHRGSEGNFGKRNVELRYHDPCRGIATHRD